MDRSGFITRSDVAGATGKKLVEFTFDKISAVSPSANSLLRGPSFHHGGHHWFLEVKSFTTGGQAWLSLFLVLENGNYMHRGLECLTKFAYTVVDPLDDANNVTKPENLEAEGFVVYNSSNHSWGYSKFIPLSELARPDRGFLTRDRLVVRVELVSLVTALDVAFDGLGGSKPINFGGFDWGIVAQKHEEWLSLYLKMLDCTDTPVGPVQTAVKTLFRVTARRQDDKLLYDTKLMPNPCVFQPNLSCGWKDFKVLPADLDASHMKLSVRVEFLSVSRLFTVSFGKMTIADTMNLSTQFRYRNVDWTVGQVEKDKQLGVFLCCNSNFLNFPMKCRAKYKISIPCHKVPRNTVEETYEMEFSSNCLCWGKPRFIPVETLLAPENGYIVDGQFNVQLEFMSVEILRDVSEQQQETEPVVFKEEYENAKKRKLEQDHTNGVKQKEVEAQTSHSSSMWKTLFMDTLRSTIQNTDIKSERLPKVRNITGTLKRTNGAAPTESIGSSLVLKEAQDLFVGLKEIVDQSGPLSVMQLGEEYQKKTGMPVQDAIDKAFPRSLASLVSSYQHNFQVNAEHQVISVSTDGPSPSSFPDHKVESKAKLLQLNDSATLLIGQAVEELCNYLKKKLPLNINRIVLPRPATNPTVLLPGEEVEAVVFVDDIPLRGHTLWRQPLLSLFEQVLKDLPHCTGVAKGPYCIYITFHSISFGVYPCANFSSRKELREEMNKNPSTWITVAACEDRLTLLVNQPPAVKDAIKLLKQWRSAVTWHEQDQCPSSYMLELLAIHSSKGGAKNTAEVFKRTLYNLQHFGSIQAKWTDLYSEEMVPKEVLSQIPLILDPTNPAFNLAADFDWSVVQAEAQMEPLSASLQLLLNS